MASSLCFFILLVSVAHARQHYRARIPNGNIVPCPPGDPHCDEGSVCEGIGHESCAGGVITPKLNEFGKDLLREHITWSKKLCEMDSDGDGFTNGEELGDPCCIWKEGASSPQWMLDWPVSHPGFADSKQLPNPDIKERCKTALPLETAKFYNEDEEQITLEFPIAEQVIPPQETTYIDYRLNLPEGKTYYVVGTEALLDNAEILHHFVVRSCTTKVEQEGVVPYNVMQQECVEGVHFWAPGSEAFAMPSNAAIAIGEGTGRVGLILRMHYDNPLLKEGMTDKSGVRLHVTTKPRDHEIANFVGGTSVSVGTIKPGKKFLSSSLAQIVIDKEMAPDGVTVFAFFPHMHLTGRRMFTERFKIKSDAESDYPLDLSDLEKIGDLARDDKWSFYNQRYEHIEPIQVQDGEILATTCIYDGENRNEETVGGLGSRDEMCVIGLGYYPAEAVKTRAVRGPGFVGDLDDEQFETLPSLLDFIESPKIDSSFPEWRRAYLEGDIACDKKALEGTDLRSAADVAKLLGNACGEKLGQVLLTHLGDKEDLNECSPECAKAAYNLMGCSLLKNGLENKKVVYPLYPSSIEIDVENYCKEAFLKLLDGEKQSADVADESLGRRFL